MTKPISVLIVEDEFLTADTIKDGLEEIGYRVSGMAKDAVEAFTILEKGHTDIAILDINIQGARDGIWLGEQIHQKFGIPFLYLSAYSDADTLQSAIATQPHSFLVKPFNKVDIYSSIELALQNFARLKGTQVQKEAESAPLLKDDYLFVKQDHLYCKVVLRDILYVQSELKYVQIFLPHKKYLLRFNLSDMLAMLPAESFVQVHRSYLVNKDHIDEMGPDFVRVADQKIPLSASHRKNLRKVLNML
ncbi:MAG: LytR/AlgR family response regulator transcription factor [Salibacteraceae bacterium]